MGYDFATMTGFAAVPASLGFNGSRVDRTPALNTTFRGGSVELHIFVDGQLIETFFGGETTITTATNNQVNMVTVLHTCFYFEATFAPFATSFRVSFLYFF